MATIAETSGQSSVKTNAIHGVSLNKIAAQWRTKEHEDTTKKNILKEDILKRIDQATKLIKESTGNTCDDKIEKMEWDSLYELSANVMDDYTRHVDQLLTQLDKLYQQQYLWQEAAFVMDSHRGATLIEKAEQWMKLKEQHLEYKLNELGRSATEIKTTIERLTTEE